MCLSSQIYINNNFRFKRWSRKSYAIFSGINKIISIGTLTADICEASLEKVKKQILPFAINKESETPKNEELETDLLIFEMQFSTIIIPIISNKKHCPKNIELNHIKHT